MKFRVDNEVAPERGDLISLSAALVSSACVSDVSLRGEEWKRGWERMLPGRGLILRTEY